MQTIQLFINEHEVDLSDDNPIALTYQINNLADVKNQSGNTSNQFKLPLTQKNRRILGYPDDVKLLNVLPYTQLRVKLVQDGIEIIPYGIGEINNADENNIDITVLSGNVDFFDQIDMPIYDMGDKTKAAGVKQPFAPYNHTWDLNTAVATRNKTDGFIYPVIDYGSLSAIKPYTVDVRQLRPAFFLKTAIDLILARTGYKGAGSLLSNPLYNKLLIPFANDDFEHGADYQAAPDSLGIVAVSTVDQSKSHQIVGVTFGGLNFDRVDSDPQGQYSGNTFTANKIFTAEVEVKIPSFSFRGRVNDSNASSVNIKIFLNAGPDGTLEYVLTYDLTGGFTRVEGTSGSTLQGYTTFGPKTLTAEIDLKIGYQIAIGYEFFGDRPAFFTMFNGASFTIRSKNQKVLFGQEVQCERIFPDISQKDLLKDTLQRFGIICQTDNNTKTVTFATFKDIVKNIPVAKNWTKKCYNIGKNIAFNLGNYAQVNSLKYKKDDAITEGYADDIINVDDKTLQATAELFTSQFAPSLNSPFVGGSVAQIKKIEDPAEGLEFTIGTTARILVDNKVNLFAGRGETVRFTDGISNLDVNDVISAPYFYKENGDYNLCWKDQPNQPGLRSIYYPELEKILYRCKKVTRYFILTPRDILELDLLVPVYLEQDNAYYYINKIDAWRKGQPVKVELVKLGEYE